MSKHTPGPWEVYETKDRDGDSALSIRGNKEFIATMDLCSIGGAPFTLPPNGASNALLIAAAPELLEALEAIVGGSCPHGAYWKVDAEDIDKAKAAIAKAKGV